MTTAPLLESAGRLGHLVWYSRQAFSLFGDWAGDDRTPPLARRFGTFSNEYSAHAKACLDRLPTIALTSGDTVAPEQFVAAPDADDEKMVTELADATSLDERSSGARRLLQRMSSLVGEHRALVDPILDEPTATVLDDLASTLATHLDA